VVLEQLNELANGAKIYLCPVAPVYGSPDAVSCAQSGLQFSGFRVMAREKLDVIADFNVSAKDLTEALDVLPEFLRVQVESQLSALLAIRPALNLPSKVKPTPFTKPLIMGILNVTPDSFSDGGKYLEPVHAVTQARKMIAAGADIIDIGGESTRPGAEPVWEGEEAERVVPVIQALQDDAIPLSIDTRHSFVMEKALEAGAHIINDVSAMTYDPESMRIAAASTAPVILMHAQGKPKTMQDSPEYQHALLDVYDYLEERIQACVAAGISRDRLVIDPGIGFGKRMVQDNLALINGLPLLHTLGCPILFGASRKSFIGAVTGENDASKRLPGSLMAAMKAIELGAQIVRVHDVAETKQALSMVQAFRDAAIMDTLKAEH